MSVKLATNDAFIRAVDAIHLTSLSSPILTLPQTNVSGVLLEGSLNPVNTLSLIGVVEQFLKGYRVARLLRSADNLLS